MNKRDIPKIRLNYLETLVSSSAIAYAMIKSALWLRMNIPSDNTILYFWGVGFLLTSIISGYCIGLAFGSLYYILRNFIDRFLLFVKEHRPYYKWVIILTLVLPLIIIVFDTIKAMSEKSILIGGLFLALITTVFTILIYFQNSKKEN